MDKHLKAKKILALIEKHQDNKSALEIAKLAGYADNKSMSRFLRSVGYKWDYSKRQYIRDTIDLAPKIDKKKEKAKQAETTNKIDSKAVTVTDNNQQNCNCSFKDNEERILEMLNDYYEKKSYRVSRFPSAKITKSFRIADEVEELLLRFSKDYGNSQQDIINTALYAFLKQFYEEYSS